MICKTCNIAGDLVAVARDKFENEDIYIQEFPMDTKEAIRSVAHLYHGLCKGCDCQHKIDFEGKSINVQG